MPNRMLRESFLTSESVGRLDWFEQAAMTRLILCCDDFGRMDARPRVLRSRLFPMCEGVTLEMIERALAKMEALGTLRRYEVNALPYLVMTNWFTHQKPRFRVAKHPPEPAEMAASERDLQHSDGSHEKVEVEVEAKVEAEVEASEPAREPAPGSGCAASACGSGSGCAASACGSGSGCAGASDLLAVDLPNGARPFRLTPGQAQQLLADYPQIDVAKQMRKMADWLKKHPQEHKGRAKMLDFVRDWLERCGCPRASDAHAPPRSPGPPPQNPANKFLQRKYDDAFFDQFFEG